MATPPRLALALAFAATACGSDLPPGWEGAKSLPIVQTECQGSPYDGPPEEVQVTPRSGGVDLLYDNAHFRCDQKVEGFIRWSGANADVLVQPKDMNPSKVAGCDCLYRITASIPGSPGDHEITLFRRWDEHGGHSDPVRVGAAHAVVP